MFYPLTQRKYSMIMSLKMFQQINDKVAWLIYNVLTLITYNNKNYWPQNVGDETRNTRINWYAACDQLRAGCLNLGCPNVVTVPPPAPIPYRLSPYEFGYLILKSRLRVSIQFDNCFVEPRVVNIFITLLDFRCGWTWNVNGI